MDRKAPLTLSNVFAANYNSWLTFNVSTSDDVMVGNPTLLAKGDYGMEMIQVPKACVACKVDNT